MIVDASAESETYFLRHYIAKAFGIKTGLGVPILPRAQAHAVLVFFRSQICEEDPQVIELAMAAAAQVARISVTMHQLFAYLMYSHYPSVYYQVKTSN